ncbi:MAG: SMC family ATPase [Chloroflexi bacterium]|nr:SMC family ATPase [Chloroflexota bacterium]
MIPIKLALHNFMPYRDSVPPLYFNGIHTASICGDNGNGKSALIDAITWALWGKARARSDDDLIYQNETETEVEFDFAVEQQTYRIIRKHAKPKRRQSAGRSILEFQIATGNGFKSITGNSIPQTQQEIIKVLHMDYDTFVNSAYIRQGHADEFTIARPAERKQTLANILGLSYYDELEEQARGLAKDRQSEISQLQSAIKDIDDELSHKPSYEVEFIEAQGKLAGIEEAIKGQEVKLSQLRQAKETLENKKAQLLQLEQHAAEITKALGHWNSQMVQHRSRIEEYEGLIARRDNIEEGYNQLTSARKLSEELNQKLRVVTSLNERRHQLEMAIMKASQALLKDHALTQSKIGELEVKVERLRPLKNDLQQIQLQLQQLTEQEEILRNRVEKSQELRTHIHGLELSKTRLEQEIVGIEEKLKLLLTKSGVKCPLCEAELGSDGLKLIEDKYAAEKQQKSDSLKSNQRELATKKTELNMVDSEVSRLEAKLKQERGLAQGKAGLLTQQITEAEKAGSQLVEEKAKLVEIEESLATKDFAASEQAALKQLEAELAKLAYDPAAHEEVRRSLAELEQYENPRRKLEEADRLITQEREALSRAEQAIQELRHSMETDNQKRQDLASELGALPQLVRDLAGAETGCQALRAQQKQAQETLGSIKGKLERCLELERRKKEKERAFSEAIEEEAIYRDLTEAFGKKGIQALLIEMTLPEIEAEANRLLGRMTDNRMNVKFETQRESKKGEPIETLDINIADELGTRNYEMFSGGEAFRINFAIRIALSKLLAKRAGAPLPTLIIDEGFGTQDSTGLEKLKEAITSIQDDFEKIIVITHIADLRDAFPTRIDVVKTAQGSTIEVS